MQKIFNNKGYCCFLYNLTYISIRNQFKNKKTKQKSATKKFATNPEHLQLKFLEQNKITTNNKSLVFK